MLLNAGRFYLVNTMVILLYTFEIWCLTFPNHFSGGGGVGWELYT